MFVPSFFAILKTMKIITYIFLGFLAVLSLREYQGQGIILIDTVNFIFHEAGHPIFSLLGEFMQFLGGTLGQLIIPLIFLGYFFVHRQFFSSGVMLWWFGQNFIGIGTYIADARAQVLELIGGEHDWAYLLGKLGLLKYDQIIGGTVQVVGLVIMFSSIVFMLHIVHKDSLSQ
jgi:hypothetical protein